MKREKRTIEGAFDNLHIALAEALFVATKTERLPPPQAEWCLFRLDSFGKQIDDLRGHIRSKAK
jgi:hypothetical protein